VATIPELYYCDDNVGNVTDILIILTHLLAEINCRKTGIIPPYYHLASNLLLHYLVKFFESK